jgi:DNA-directed RNA polymerase II subunit RPB1
MYSREYTEQNSGQPYEVNHMKFERWNCGPMIMARFLEIKRIVLCHSAGIASKNITLGVPRLKELINVSNKLKSPSLTVYLKDQVTTDKKEGSKEISETIKNKLEYKVLKDIILESKISSNDPEKVTDPFVKAFQAIPDPTQPDLTNLALELTLDTKALEYTQITLFDIVDKIGAQTNLDDSVFIQFNDDNSERPTLRISMPVWSEDEETHEHEMVEILKKLEVDFLNKIHLQGLPGIDKVFISERTQDTWIPEKGFVPHKIKFIETEGTNLQQSFSIPEVDHTKTFSNNIIEIYGILGIEAARKALLNELRLVLSFDGSYVNYRHLAILTDIMTYKGILMSITRHGINRIETGTLMKCSFEETVEVLTESAAYSQRDTIKGVSENIMLGQLAPFGTGMFNVMLNEKSVDKYSEIMDRMKERDLITVDGRGNIKGSYSEQVNNYMGGIESGVRAKDTYQPSGPSYGIEMEIPLPDYVPSEPSYGIMV